VDRVQALSTQAILSAKNSMKVPIPAMPSTQFVGQNVEQLELIGQAIQPNFIPSR
jgi:hypothetical protein